MRTRADRVPIQLEQSLPRSWPGRNQTAIAIHRKLATALLITNLDTPGVSRRLETNLKGFRSRTRTALALPLTARPWHRLATGLKTLGFKSRVNFILLWSRLPEGGGDGSGAHPSSNAVSGPNTM